MNTEDDDHWKERLEGWTAAMNGESPAGPYQLWPSDQSYHAAWMSGYHAWVKMFGLN